VRFPSTIAYVPPDNLKHPDYKPTPPAVQAMPVQEPGIRPARAVPYELHASSQINPTEGVVTISLGNTGKSAAVYQIYSGKGQLPPRTYTVGPTAEISDSWSFLQIGQTQYDLSVFGPNGFLRVFQGGFGAGNANLQSDILYVVRSRGVSLQITNQGAQPCQVGIFDFYTQKTTERTLSPNQSFTQFWSLERFHGWYDFTVQTGADPIFQRRLAGHLETGSDSMSDPAFASLT
jgi:phospholipase C